MLPGLAPNHTRGGFMGGSRLHIDTYAASPDDYSRVGEHGLWLLPGAVTQKEVATRKVGKDTTLEDRLAEQERHGMEETASKTRTAIDILSNSKISSIGCMTNALADGWSIEEQTLLLAELETGTFSFDLPNDLPHLRVCEDETCYNPRHYDLSFGRATLPERAVELNPEWYEELASGKIKTAWGHTLPSVAKSLELFIKMQRLCFPFVDTKKSKLTPGAISQIRPHPYTGCWESWSYFISSFKNGRAQSDGYGRLNGALKIKGVDYETGEITWRDYPFGHRLAHRVVWAASPGRYLVQDQDLNHLCSYRRCCNPLHIEQITHGENVRHGANVQNFFKSINDTDLQASRRMSAEELVPYHQAVRQMYIEICKAKGLNS